MNRKLIRKWKKFKDKFEKLHPLVILGVVGGIIGLICIIIGVNSVIKLNKYNDLVSKVEDATKEYVQNFYPSIDTGAYIMLTLNDLVGEKYIATLESPYGGVCNVDSNIQVEQTATKQNIIVDLECGSKTSNNIENPIILLKDGQFNSNMWSNQDVRIQITGVDEVMYTLYSNSEIVEYNANALNNEIIVSEEGLSYILIKTFIDSTLDKTFYTPIYKIDKELPVIDLVEETILVDQGTIYETTPCVANDNLTSSESIACNIMGIVNTEVVDSYPLEYTAVDLAGNVSTKNITVVVKSPYLKDVLTTKNYSGLALDNYVSFNNATWRIMGHNGTNVKIVGPELTNRVYDASYSTIYEEYNTWLSDSRRYNSNASSLQRYLSSTYYDSLTTRAKDMIDTTIFEDTIISVPSLSDWEICAGLNVTDSNWTETYTTGTFMTTNCYLKQSDSHTYWTNTAYPNTDDRVWKIDRTGSAGNNTVTNSFHILPVVYLQDNVVVLGGSGIETDPYIIGQ